jgi:hypothetical protein
MMLSENYNTGLMDILGEYAPLVEASFAGHTHMDEFRIVSSNAHPHFLVHITPSVSPVFGNNPSFQRFEYDKLLGTITDYTTYILKNFSSARNEGDTDWEMEYNYSMTYGQHGYTPANAAALYESLEHNSSASADYKRFYSGGTGRVISDKNWKAVWCGIGNVDAGSFASCYCGEK